MVSSWKNIKVLDLNDNQFVGSSFYLGGVCVCRLLYRPAIFEVRLKWVPGVDGAIEDLDSYRQQVILFPK
jgi:hypothetical protein